LNKYQEYLNNIVSCKILYDEPLSKYTTFGIGGPASCLIYPNNSNELSIILSCCYKNNVPVIFIGSGSNLLICDQGFNGVVISLRKTFKKLSIENNGIIFAQSGVMLGNMVKIAIQNNIIGLESLVGVPGTVGGALIMNAGAYGQEISNHFIKAKTMTMEGKIKKYLKNDIQFCYRRSTFPVDEILIEAIFKCKKGNHNKIINNKETASIGRKSTQPLKFRSAGSIFKNPSNQISAGYLIDQAGLKGSNYGGASISEKHANFIINLGNATASDVLYLIILAKNEVSKKFNIDLELEIKLIGFPKSKIEEINYA